MRVVAVALMLVIASLAAAAGRPEPASACVGRTLDFEGAIPLSNGAIYGGRITRADIAATFWIDLTIDIDVVIRGPAPTRIRRAQAGDVCDGIDVGQYGFIVRGFRDPGFPDSGRQDVFFRVSRSQARAALLGAGLPDTSTLPHPGSQEPPSLPWAWLAFWLVSAFVLTLLGRRGRRGRRATYARTMRRLAQPSGATRRPSAKGLPSATR